MTPTRGTAVVTGAAGGLGQQIVRDLTDAGYDVVATDVVAGNVPENLTTLDVRDAAACRDLAHTVKPVVWVNAAGVLGAGDAATQDDSEVEQVVAVNLLGVMNGTRAAVAVMRETGGHIINVASLAAWVPVPGECVYAATKAGVLSFSLGLRAELRAQGVRHIDISVVCPDGMMTPMITDIIDDPAIALTFSAPRLTTPTAVSRRVLSLLQRPRAVASVPRWRGAQVRALGMVPDLAVRALPVFRRMGLANQARERARWNSGSS